jgi:hypothetical protein
LAPWPAFRRGRFSSRSDVPAKSSSRQVSNSSPTTPKGVMFPTIDDGMKSLAFVEAAVKSGKANAKWVRP